MRRFWPSVMTRRLFVPVVALGLSLGVAACGSSESSGGAIGVKSSTIGTAIPKSGCGAAPTPAPDDPDHVLSTLPESYAKAYAGYRTPVHKSVWTSFKASHPPPYRVSMAFAQLTTDSQLKIYETLKRRLGNDPDIEFTAVTTGDQLNIPQQLQQYDSLLSKHPDLLIVEPLTDAFGALANKAGRQGIPTLSVLGITTSKYAINLQRNGYGDGAQGSSVVFRQIGGKGNVLFVHGIASSASDQDVLAGYMAALKNCPGIKQAGQIAGAFVPATAKAETLKFLATHPGRIDAVVQAGGMAPGIISAFKQAGRPIPVVTDMGGMRGSLGYWNDNQDTYHGFAQPLPAINFGNAIASFSKRMLAGRGPKISDVTDWFPAVTDADLDQWVEPGWDLNTPGSADGPPDAWISDKFIADLFKDPAPAK